MCACLSIVRHFCWVVWAEEIIGFIFEEWVLLFSKVLFRGTMQGWFKLNDSFLLVWTTKETYFLRGVWRFSKQILNKNEKRIFITFSIFFYCFFFLLSSFSLWCIKHVLTRSLSQVKNDANSCTQTTENWAIKVDTKYQDNQLNDIFKWPAKMHIFFYFKFIQLKF